MRKLLKKKFVMKKIEIISNKISNIWREYFIIRNAYAGIAFSFQWSLILSWGITCMTFFITLRIEFRTDGKLNWTKASIDKIQANNRTKWFIWAHYQILWIAFFSLSCFLMHVWLGSIKSPKTLIELQQRNQLSQQ